jgi:hypothetical protein
MRSGPLLLGFARARRRPTPLRLLSELPLAAPCRRLRQTPAQPKQSFYSCLISLQTSPLGRIAGDKDDIGSGASGQYADLAFGQKGLSCN